MKSGAEAKKKRMSELLKQRIRRGFQTEQIEGRQYTYSLLRKKNKKFVLYNQRLLLLKGVETIAYAAWGSQELPFQNQHNLPNPKAQTSILNISNVDHKQEMLLLQFYPSAQLDRWQFSCSSSQIASNWVHLIQSAISSCKLIKSNYPIQINIPHSEQTQQSYVISRPPVSKQGHLDSSSKLLAKSMSRGKLSVIHQQEEESQSKRSSISGYFEVLKHAKSTPAFKAVQSNQQQYEQNAVNYNEQAFLKKGRQQQRVTPGTPTTQRQNNHSEQSFPAVDYLLPSPAPDTVSLHSAKSSYSRLPGWNWSYQFLKGDNEQQVIEKFKVFSQNCVKIIIEQLASPVKSKLYTNISSSSSLQFESDGVRFTFCSIWLEESSIFSGAKPIIQTKRVKEAQHELKSANYILQATKNKGKIRVPLMQLIQYKGFIVIAKAQGKCIALSSSSPLKEVDFDELQRETGISSAKIKENSSIRVGVADQGFYEDLARAENSYRRYEVCFLSNIHSILPKDIYRQRQGRNQYLRPQVILQQSEPLSHSSISTLRRQGSSRSLSHQSSVKSLQSQYTSIAQRMKNLISELQNLTFLFANPEQLSALLHKHGVNIRYLGLAAKECTQLWLKAILLGDIAARSSKYFIYLQLQKKVTKGANQRGDDEAIDTVIGWMNSCFGVGRSSDLQWAEISLQAEALFDYSVKKQEIDTRFFILALQYHCRFSLKNLDKNATQTQFLEGQVREYQTFSRQNFGQFTIHSKIFDYSFTESSKNWLFKLQRFNEKDRQQLINIIFQQIKDPQSSLNHSPQNQRIVLSILDHLNSSQLSLLNSKMSQRISSLSYQVQLSYFRATLRQNLPICDRIRDNIILQTCRWNGQSHPIMVHICNSLSSAYLHYTSNENRAISYKLAGLRLQTRLLGASHLRLAQTHYELAVIYYKYFKKQESLLALKRSYQILKQNKAEISEENLKVLLKLGQLSLVTGSPKQAFILGKLAYSISKDMGNYHYLLESGELLGRSYECGQQWSEYIDFSCSLMPLLTFFKNSMDLQRALKVILFPFFHRISSKSKQRKTLLLRFLSEFTMKPQQIAYQFLRAKIDYNNFPLKFVGYLDELDYLSEQIERGSILSRWKGFQTIGIHTNSQQLDFLATLEALYSFLSGNFLQGIIEQSSH